MAIAQKHLSCIWLESHESGAEPTRVLGMAPTPPKFGSCFWVGDEFVPTFVWMEELKIWDGGQHNTVIVDPIYHQWTLFFFALPYLLPQPARDLPATARAPSRASSAVGDSAGRGRAPATSGLWARASGRELCHHRCPHGAACARAPLPPPVAHERERERRREGETGAEPLRPSKFNG
jgi:hypothetical protein